MWSSGGVAGAGARDDGEEGEADDGAPPAPPHAGPAGTAAGGRPGQGGAVTVTFVSQSLCLSGFNEKRFSKRTNYSETCSQGTQILMKDIKTNFNFFKQVFDTEPEGSWEKSMVRESQATVQQVTEIISSL